MIETENISIDKITAIDLYFERLISIQKDSLIIISVKDTPGFHIKETTAELFFKLGIKNKVIKKHGHAFIAIIDRGAVVYDKVSDYDETLIVEDLLLKDGPSVNVMSSIFQKENLSIIMIDGMDYSHNRRGLNIVVYSYEKSSVIDRVSFDTHNVANPCYRSNLISGTATQGMGITGPIKTRLILSRLEKQQETIDELQKKIELNNSKLELLLWQIFKNDNESEKQTIKRFFKNLPTADGARRKIQLVGDIILRHLDKVCRENNITYWLSFGTLLGAVRHGGFIPWDDDIDVCMIREDFDRLKELMKTDEHFSCYNFHEICGPVRRYVGKGYKVKIKELVGPPTLDIFVFDRGDETVANKVKELNMIKVAMADDAWKPVRLPILPATVSQIRKGFAEGKEDYNKCSEFFEQYLKKYKELIGDGTNTDYIVWGIDNPKSTWGTKRIIKSDLVFPLQELEFEGKKYFCPAHPEEYLNIFYGDIYKIPDDMLTHQHFEVSAEQEKALDAIIEKYEKE